MDQETNQQAANSTDAARADSDLKVLFCFSDGQLYVGDVQPKKKTSVLIMFSQDMKKPILFQTDAIDEEPMDTADDCNGAMQGVEEAMDID